jgi:hypothetical protein
MASPDPGRELAFEELAQTIDALRLLSDQLELVLDGDETEWREENLLDLHDAATRARHAVNTVRSMRAAEARRATVVRLVDVDLAPVVRLDNHRSASLPGPPGPGA